MRPWFRGGRSFLAAGGLALAFAGASCATGTVQLGLGGSGKGGSSTTGFGGSGGAGGASDAGPVGCLHASDCTALDDACNNGSCVDNVCAKTPSHEGASCDTGLFCQVNGVCQLGNCVGTPKDCPNGGDACHVGACDEPSKTCTLMAGNDGDFCTPMDKCYSSGFCSSGACIGSGTMTDCKSVADQCNDGMCDSVMGCIKVPKPNGTSCSDGLFCTQNDVCTNGVCGGTTSPCLPTSNACAVNNCDEPTHSCKMAKAPDGTACSTSNMCLQAEACAGGVCAGGTPANEGMACPGNGSCVTNSKCTMGKCTGTPVTACVGGDGCCPAGCTSAMDSDCNCMQNLALTATPIASAGGSLPGYTATEMNNGVGKSQCAKFSWITNGSAPSGAYWELDWAAPVTIGSFYVEAASIDGTGQCATSQGRNIASADVQTWNGSAWVTQTSFNGKSGDIQINLSPPVTTTKLRLFNVTSGPTCGGQCNGNSIMWEWHVYDAAGCIPPAD